MSCCFDASRVVGFGVSGQQTVRQMAEAIEKPFKGKCELIYNEVTKKFTILNSSEVSIETIQDIFSKHKYDGWQPEVESLADSEGNKIAKLIMVSPQARDSLIPASKLGAKQSEFDQSISSKPTKLTSTRQETAYDLVLKMKLFKIIFENKKCLDVGCRSGENAFAMQEAGAIVTAIDPDDSEFESALKLGIPKEQLHKLTLQEYYKPSLKENFDIATVFLYCIPLIERETFMDALVNIIKKSGTVVIGYAFEDGPLYDKDPDLNLPKLMKKYFKYVQRVEYPGDLNHYLLICRHNES
jgi:2-polyprenyl-3-methyl-5-hydroxy-6-metoxy-1,4-benzoquinol methylase